MEYTERYEQLERSHNEIVNKINEHQTELQKLLEMRNATLGAMSECKFWIKKNEEKSEKVQDIKEAKK